MYKKILQIFSWIAAQTLIILMYVIRPMLGPMNVCPYTIGCTQYAILQLQDEPFLPALRNIISRLLQCHPFGNRKL